MMRKPPNVLAQTALRPHQPIQARPREGGTGPSVYDDDEDDDGDDDDDQDDDGDDDDDQDDDDESQLMMPTWQSVTSTVRKTQDSR